MPDQRPPNILFLMTDQMQGLTLRPDHPLREHTPHLNALMQRGVRFGRAYTPNAICSPARASLMTGLLPHNHGMTTVTHAYDADLLPFREDRPHFAQRLEAAGYDTGYFGKWHVEHTDELERFGWSTNAARGTPLRKAFEQRHPHPPLEPIHRVAMAGPLGFRDTTLYQVDRTAATQRPLGWDTQMALDYLAQPQRREQPWCCFVSCLEPHDPFVCGERAYRRFDIDGIELPANAGDAMTDKPGLYSRAAERFAFLSDRQRREAMACYWASIVEIDEQYGRLLERLDHQDMTDNTIVVFTSDHGEMLGAHGLYMKNIGAFEETYHIPLVVAGPGVASGAVSNARVGLHDLAPTLCTLAKAEPIGDGDGRDFTPVLRAPVAAHDFRVGLAEFEGTRHRLTQRIVYDDRGGECWKLVHNGFDYDELYDLQHDPGETHNLAASHDNVDRYRAMLKLMWSMLRDSGDRTLLNLHYPVLRLTDEGPLAAEVETP
jgi:arylsulfatase A-like enzyme